MGARSYSDIKDSLRNLYVEDPRPWLVGFSGGKDSTMLASLNYPLCKLYASLSRFPLSTLNGGKVMAGPRFQPYSKLGTCHHLTLPVLGIQIDARTSGCGSSRFRRASPGHL